MHQVDVDEAETRQAASMTDAKHHARVLQMLCSSNSGNLSFGALALALQFAVLHDNGNANEWQMSGATTVDYYLLYAVTILKGCG